jgi:hypothetical protein
VFRQLVLARIIEPASKQDSLRVLEEAGAPAPSYPTLNRRLPAWAEESWRQGLSEACAAHARLPDVTVVADAGIISEANQKAIEAAGLSFILGMKIPEVPYQVAQWRRVHPGEEIPDGHVFIQPWPAGPSPKRRDQMIYYRFRATGRGGRCAGSMSRSPRRQRPAPPSPRASSSGATASSGTSKNRSGCPSRTSGHGRSAIASGTPSRHI